jgi:hypothetical protein
MEACMNFLLTTFFKDLTEPITLLESRGLVLDNPRSEKELDHVTQLLTRAFSMDGVHVSMLPGIAVHAPWPDGLDAIRARTLAAVTDDEIPAEAALALMAQIAQAAAPHHVICRFDDSGAYEELVEMRKDSPPNSFVLLHDDHPLVKRSREAFQLGHLIAVLACDEGDEDTLGLTFILDDTPDWSVELGELLASAMVARLLISTDRAGPGGWRFADLDYYSTRLAEIGGQLDQRLGTTPTTDPLLYAGELMAIAAATRDGRTRLVNLVALLELLLTRNPDASRFNVEDSLTKQFVLKLGVLLHRQAPSLDLEWTRKALKDLYGLRSAIAHGDFGRLDGVLAKSRFAKPDADDFGFSPAAIALDVANEFAYRCVRCAVRASLDDPPLVEFLKQN